MLVLLLAEGEEAGSAGAVGGGVAPEEEGLASSLLMLGYGELQFDPLPPPMPGLPAPWLSVRPQISQPDCGRVLIRRGLQGFAAFNAAELDTAVTKRRSISTMQQSGAGRGGRSIAIGGTRGVGCAALFALRLRRA